MDTFRSSSTTSATPEGLFAALTTTAGVRGWWTTTCEVASEVGGAIHLRFGDTRKELRVVSLVPGREVRWRCVAAHIAAPGLGRRDEWVGTEMVFRLAPEGVAGTRLDFEHVGLAPALECFTLCVQGWRHFLASLIRYAETGRGTPYEPAPGAACQSALQEARP